MVYVDRLGATGRLQTPDIASLSISSLSDYHVFDFPGKDLQREQVVDLLDQQGFIPDDLIEQEVEWFYTELGIDDVFFAKEDPQVLSNLILTLYSAKLESFAEKSILDKSGNTQESAVNDYLTIEKKIHTEEGHAIFLESNDVNTPYKLDSQIDNLFLDNDESHRLVSFWAPNSNMKLTFIYKSVFPGSQESAAAAASASPQKYVQGSVGEIDSISDKTMIQILSAETKKLYSLLINLVKEREGPVIKITPSQANKDEIRFLVAYRSFTTKHYYSALNSLFHYYKLRPSKFYVESFANDVTIYSVYLNKSQQREQQNVVPEDIEDSIRQIEREASLLFAIPNSFFIPVYEQRQFSPQEAIYAHIAAIFINHFINRLGPDYANLIATLAPKQSDITLLEIIGNLKKKLRNETFTAKLIIASLQKHYTVVSKLYKNFAQLFYYHNEEEDKRMEKTLSYKRLAKLEPFQNDQEFDTYLNKFIPNDSPDFLILKTLNLFNKSILKTNFYVTRKVAVSFRLDPKLIMPKVEYPDTPYGVFFVVGNTFEGFHIRFRDIARGGIRIVTSKTQDIFEANSRTAIDENYQLASTQQRKNKDIPEGGSKGVILLHPGITDKKKTFIAFSQYVDAMIDILIKDPLKDPYVDYMKHEEILFFGPDEGTATFVDWATTHARKRGCPWWKSFLTGKSQTLGGIPHDEYGMTSLGVRKFVTEMYETLNLTKKEVFKFQTGGPDGDLGSNEILLSTENETYVGLLDGSGVLCDPKGLNKQELMRLAKTRDMCSSFDKAKLSNVGFFVSVDDMDFMLPNGVIVSNGTTFRNVFHTEIFKYVDRVDLFVPCGGRPNSINLNNLHCFIDEKTSKCKIPCIVEGANLFIAQPAKIALEQHGCVLFKDASANKGGVTSSSMEVLASLALSDDDFVNKFVGKANGDVTELYKEYVLEVQRRIEYNAQQEFKQLWSINQASGTPISDLSNVLSLTINKLNDDLVDSQELWLNDLKLRNYLLLKKIIPGLLTEVAGADQILKNIPESYLKVMLSSYLSSSYVYRNGIDVNIGKFLEYIGELRREAQT
ncbi:glutamate dehydrogenase (NAD(+)) KNAG_0L02290 [Huiozyma naganishii CBS 8797]|uniref:NAD-specific glutamate dehydrogenase n=1 Tax=Huiozyma naganishii (strain ATCC MYA-139 / BCRC 22969 / CBS 8797 / KCTC 17520 / NBRC 10181 / NCYC 3082 / Yp74L-3) TaxID=1071383 RepID=J7RD80_HUIN7|nr:hypothetical protein KNAG_0L02290 [Kazachstania naganishii CBS 8797]CCK72845.1 hypothetical protein KNAG_0L02290 [Kazachstania naganishii CBS 8797]